MTPGRPGGDPRSSPSSPTTATTTPWLSPTTRRTGCPGTVFPARIRNGRRRRQPASGGNRHGGVVPGHRCPADTKQSGGPGRRVRWGPRRSGTQGHRDGGVILSRSGRGDQSGEAMGQFDDKVAIVTGSGGGIGQAYAEALRPRGRRGGGRRHQHRGRRTGCPRDRRRGWAGDRRAGGRLRSGLCGDDGRPDDCRVRRYRLPESTTPPFSAG